MDLPASKDVVRSAWIKLPSVPGWIKSEPPSGSSLSYVCKVVVHLR